MCRSATTAPKVLAIPSVRSTAAILAPVPRPGNTRRGPHPTCRVAHNLTFRPNRLNGSAVELDVGDHGQQDGEPEDELERIGTDTRDVQAVIKEGEHDGAQRPPDDGPTSPDKAVPPITAAEMP